MEQRISIDRLEQAVNIFGSFDENIRLLEKEFSVTVVNRDGELRVDGKEIKSALIAKAKVADYQTINGTTVVTCTCPLPLRYLCKRRLDNNAQIIANNRKLLFKNRNLVYQTWYICEIAPQYEEEYKRLTNILRSLASEDKIDINFVICEKREKKIYPFPSQIEGFHLDCDLILSVEAQSRV